MFFQGCVIQDGRLSATFIRKQYGAITLYWIEILTSICFYFVPEVTPNKVKVLEIAKNGRKLLETAEFTRNSRNLPENARCFCLTTTYSIYVC